MRDQRPPDSVPAFKSWPVWKGRGATPRELEWRAGGLGGDAEEQVTFVLGFEERRVSP